MARRVELFAPAPVEPRPSIWTLVKRRLARMGNILALGVNDVGR